MIITFLVVSLLLLFTRVVYAQSPNNIKPALFASFVDSIKNDSKIHPVQTYFLERLNYFQDLYNDSEYYFDEIIKFIKNQEKSDEDKFIVIYVAQSLPLGRYLEFTNVAIDLFEKNLLSESLLFEIIYPVGWKTHNRFVLTYGHPLVKKMLKRAAGLKKKLKIYGELFHDIYTGKRLKQIYAGKLPPECGVLDD